MKHLMFTAILLAMSNAQAADAPPIAVEAIGNDGGTQPAPCPQHITFNFRITGPENTEVTYRVVRSDGGKSAPVTASLGSAGTLKVNNAMTVGSAKTQEMRAFDGWVKLEVIAPLNVVSAPSEVHMRCSS